ncbi:heptaprenyl diphosphate synthase component II [Paenibacillus thiaminolyticus]|uniref:Heptaprenyl diphosphate synthase component II n=1 Tax=Paenibacillus thiaminolyticus TaxID=49283 RepID=A0AAP9DUX7_PANTH|nr:heptaprenyl diphosphate synthase component II [Paenibacillus thiaminolyticus]MCY9537885.1 heptaprenyl diphosphate synthase component II [Paenibacillus thiaminolyticus]MCY9602641.1 heptaprenyl diphosphate synthase component II [Paenibacillus thiaminolyticus]MCY9611068.1 heptaprenyl diphosphate synthase component II [Paenibacillus thiaminolyticus]MCY9616738.1 heptaprenyl diphosphate synthase component II [Paenibacillus thiaminolyticus]MCY9619438.1 heptaprenyl diphosphate synthase component II
MKLWDIYATMKQDVSYIEKQLERSIATDLRTLNDASLQLLKAGGKRIRPVFVLLAGKFGTYDLERLKYVAVPLELIHMASLVHDDVIDDADMRRGQLTVKAKWDNRVAMYTGDYIYGQALVLATELQEPQIHRILSKAMVQMCIGEMEQIRDFFNTSQSERQYLLRIRRKTALLIAISCQLGAIASGATAAIGRQLYRFGYNVGMAFQIRDDVLDLTGTEAQLGKPPGNDIRQGNLTLPVIYALEETGRRQALLRDIEHIRSMNGHTDVSSILHNIRDSAGIRRAEQLAERYINKAIQALEQLPDIRARKNLRDIAYFIANRSH